MKYSITLVIQYSTAYGGLTTRNIFNGPLEFEVVGIHSITESESGSEISYHDSVFLHFSNDR